MAHSPEQVSRNRSTSTGTSELPQHEHKRPRLDHSAETTMNTTPIHQGLTGEDMRSRTASPQPATETAPGQRTPPQALQYPAQSTSIVSPTSKVTINTRPLSAQSISNDVTIPTSESAHDVQVTLSTDTVSKDESPTIINASDAESSNTVSGNASEPISISSSPSEVVIEFGPPEDVEDTTEANGWLATSGNDQQDRTRSVWESFPYHGNDTKAEILRTMLGVREALEKSNDEQFSEVLQAIIKWMTEIQPLLGRRNLQAMQEDMELIQQLSSLANSLFKRKIAMPASTSEADIMDFVKVFACTTMQMIGYDIRRLRTVSDASGLPSQPWYVSHDFIRQLTWVLLPENICSIHKVLSHTRQIQQHDFCARATAALLRDGLERPFRALLDLFNELTRTIPVASQFRAFIPHTVYYYRSLLSAISTYRIALDQKQTEELRNITTEFVTKADVALLQAITKQHPWLTIENSGTCLDNFSRLTTMSTMMFPDLAENVLKTACLEDHVKHLEQVAEFATDAYKLFLLKQFVQHGRMELRVTGIENMASTFVELWTRIQGPRNQRHIPLLNLVVDFIRNNELVKYLLGVDCHPQIVQRSANVIGFLCVSDRWESSDSDIAWRAILESQDHRSAAAVVDNLRVNLQHLNLESLAYMYRKLHEVPIERFDSRMINFIVELLGLTTQKSTRELRSGHQINATMTGLCLHLLREAHTPARSSTETAELVRENVYKFIVRDRVGLSTYNVMEMSDSERTDLLATIYNDISMHTDYATGSIYVMNALLTSLDGMKAMELLHSSQYAQFLMDDMVFLSKRHQSASGLCEKSIAIEWEARLYSLSYLVLHLPSLIDEEMCEAFWKNVLAASVPTIRSNAWATLADAYRKVGTPNPVLEYVSSQFMQGLKPSLFDKAVLEFCEASVSFEIRNTIGLNENKDLCLQIPSMERVWRIMLETPLKSVEEQAMSFIIHTYLDNPVVLNRSALSIQNTHAALVDRCIQTVIDSAEQLKTTNNENDDAKAQRENDGVSIGATNQHEVRLHRSLSLLRKFLNTLKSKPRFKPTTSEAYGPVFKTFQTRGEPVEFQVRVANPPELRNGQLVWVVGEENTGHELWQFLMDVTGWSQILIIKGGGRLQLQDNVTPVKDLKLGLGPIQISKPIGATDTGPGRAIRASSPVDSTIMHHFGELYALLEYRETVAKAIYDFLAMFSSQQNVVANIKSMTMPANSLLPVQKPFKLLYYANALRSCIEEESFSPSPNVEFLQYAVQTIVTTLSHMDIVNGEHSLCMTILKGIVETLQLALRAKVPESISSSYFIDPSSFVAHLQGAWSLVQSIEQQRNESSPGRTMNRDFLDVLIESSLHDSRLWQCVDNDQEFDQLFAFAILEDENADSRKAVREVLSRLAGVAPGKLAPKADDLRSPRGRFPSEKIDDCLKHMWNYLCPLIARACDMPSMCQQVMEASAAVFDIVSKKLDEDTLVEIFTDLKTALLAQHNPGNKVYCTNENLPYGLAKMLCRCAAVLKTSAIAVPGNEDFIRSIFQQFLFPPLSDAMTARLKEQSTPIIDQDTRTALYDLLVTLCQTSRDLGTIAAEMAESTVDKDAFPHNSMNERRALRSDQGYAGLRNLSNTCYLNSLFSQLFMNVKFRELIIGINMVDENKQKLVHELGILFANMQSSHEKYVNPEDAVDSITQYSGEQIDVTVQMDVDEFFNLLFDRLEAQIVDPGAREAFQSLYGGQLVQQIKSKECDHVSERLEPFSAVQIEIKGKSGLEEGLAAYVEGEVLQGENKYSCTSCGRHVDAVKRACLKEIPDNLIFNLKRFDYDIMTGMRCKVNDEFQFPEAIDMMPYTVDALSTSNHNLPSDLFELVGVIIHSGTAETGHYYSFVRQRPSSRLGSNSWIQFNDQDVSKFDPEQMRDQAFGGSDPGFTNFAKFYNGYMLFYQRKSSIQAYEQDYPFFSEDNTIRVDLPEHLDNRIAQENEICLRRYIAQDPSHAKFVRQIIERMHVEGEACSTKHALEDQLVRITLDYVQQVSSRWKEVPDFEETHKVLCHFAKSCPRCALIIVEWFQKETNVTTNILRAWYPAARKNFASLLYTCYSVLSPYRHSNKKDDVVSIDRTRLVHALTGCFKQVAEEWNWLQRCPRGWDQLFGLLIAITRLGPSEAHALLEHEFLSKTAEIVWIHVAANTKSTHRSVRHKYSHYLAAREKNRSFSHGTAMDFFAELLQYVKLERSYSDRSGCLDPSEQETSLLGLSEEGSFEWLRRLVAGGTNTNAADKVIKELCDYPSLSMKTASILVDGLEGSRQSAVASRFLSPCLTFIQHSGSRKYVMMMIRKSLAAIAESDGYFSGEYFEYVNLLTNLETTMTLDRAAIQNLLCGEIGFWAPALLMAPNDMHRDVRNPTIALLKQVLFDHIESLDIDEIRTDENYMKTIRALANGCIGYVSKNYTVQVRGQEQRVTLSSGQSRQIMEVLEACQKYLDATIENSEDEMLVAEVQSTVQELQELEQNVEMHDLDDWREPSSEPMSDIESFESN